MAAKKKATTGSISSTLDGLINTIATSVEEFNKIHVEHIKREAPASACVARLRIELKHLSDMRTIIINSIEASDQPEQEA